MKKIYIVVIALLGFLAFPLGCTVQCDKQQEIKIGDSKEQVISIMSPIDVYEHLGDVVYNHEASGYLSSAINKNGDVIHFLFDRDGLLDSISLLKDFVSQSKKPKAYRHIEVEKITHLHKGNDEITVETMDNKKTRYPIP